MTYAAVRRMRDDRGVHPSRLYAATYALGKRPALARAGALASLMGFTLPKDMEQALHTRNAAGRQNPLGPQAWRAVRRDHTPQRTAHTQGTAPPQAGALGVAPPAPASSPAATVPAAPATRLRAPVPVPPPVTAPAAGAPLSPRSRAATTPGAPGTPAPVPPRGRPRSRRGWQPRSSGRRTPPPSAPATPPEATP
jgi:hypothetical protein